jgi:hypothetical protein
MLRLLRRNMLNCRESRPTMVSCVYPLLAMPNPLKKTQKIVQKIDYRLSTMKRLSTIPTTGKPRVYAIRGHKTVEKWAGK